MLGGLPALYDQPFGPSRLPGHRCRRPWSGRSTSRRVARANRDQYFVVGGMTTQAFVAGVGMPLINNQPLEPSDHGRSKASRLERSEPGPGSPVAHLVDSVAPKSAGRSHPLCRVGRRLGR